jgi:hypothetical protein
MSAFSVAILIQDEVIGPIEIREDDPMQINVLTQIASSVGIQRSFGNRMNKSTPC